MELTSYAEMVLTTLGGRQRCIPPSAICSSQTEIFPSRQAILATRRPRSSSDQMPVDGSPDGDPCRDQRSAFLRNGSHRNSSAAASGTRIRGRWPQRARFPIAKARCSIRSWRFARPSWSAGRIGVIDIRNRRRRLPRSGLGCSTNISDRQLADRVFDLAGPTARSCCDSSTRPKPMRSSIGRLAGSRCLCQTAWRASASMLAQNRRGQSGLWGYGDFRRFAHRAAQIGEAGQDRSGATDRAGAWVLALEGARGGSGDLERRSSRLSAGAAGSHHGTDRRRDRNQHHRRPGGIFVRPAGRDVDRGSHSV